ncbi:MAG: DUF6323 family protein [bacterium]|nr:DUF6323 family protein [bacterium]
MFNIININNKKQELDNILGCNNITNKNNLNLTYNEALKLIENKNKLLKDLGKIEINISTTQNIIYKFYDSMYIDKENYFETINSLLEIFYFYQFELSSFLSDEEILNYMYWEFNNDCNGSLSLLKDKLYVLKEMLESGTYYE